MDERKLQEKEKKQEIDFGKIVKVTTVDEKRKWLKMRGKAKRGNGEPEI